MQTGVLAAIQSANIALLTIWLILSLVALFKLRKRESFTDWVRLAWVLIIIIIPVLGAAAFLIATSNNKK